VLRKRSLSLVADNNREFILFLQSILGSERQATQDVIWNKCDPNGLGKIDEHKFMRFWEEPVRMFKVARYQRDQRTEEIPHIDTKQLRTDYTHLATWIVRRYGTEQTDGSSQFILHKEHFADAIVSFLNAYAEAKGELYESY